MNTVAVYGSLKRGFGNHSLLSDSRVVFVGTGQTALPQFSMISFGSYPGVLKGVDHVGVEVFDVPDEVLSRLDRLEGHPNFYRRNTTPILLDNGEEIVAWMYTLIHHGDRYDGSNAKYGTYENGRLNWLEKRMF